MLRLVVVTLSSCITVAIIAVSARILHVQRTKTHGIATALVGLRKLITSVLS